MKEEKKVILHTDDIDIDIYEVQTIKRMNQIIDDYESDYLMEDIYISIKYKDNTTYINYEGYKEGKRKRNNIECVIIDDGYCYHTFKNHYEVNDDFVLTF